MSLLVEKPQYTYQKPAARVAPSAPAPQMMGLPEFKTSGEIRLLILDDDPQTCHLIQALLSNQGFVIDTLSDPSQVEGWLKGQKYHLIIMDYVLPGLEADQVLRWIRDHQPDASVIVVTAFPTVESALNCLRARTYDYLTKPFQVEQLRSLVVRCLENKGLLRMTEEALRESLGAVIRDKRKTAKLTLQQMSDRTGVSLGYLSQIELGKNSASIETLYRICLALSMKMSDLFTAIQRT
jgi:DNA-binding response OmpR family regulator